MSRLPFELQLALRYLRPKRTFVSVITLISIFGVMLGVAVLIIVISVMTGFDKELRDKILGFNAHINVRTYSGKPIKNYRELAQIISSNSHVRAVAPYVLQQSFAETQPETGEPSYSAPYIRGVDPRAETNISVLPKSMVDGEYNLRGNRIVVGQTFAMNYGLRVGDHLAIYSPRDLREMKEARKDKDADAVLPDDYEVAGIFDVGHYEYNMAFIVTSLVSAQELYGLGDAVNGIFVNLDDPYLGSKVRKELSRTIGGDIYISTWLEENSTFLNALVVEKNVMFYILFFIMIVAAFGITSAQITFVVQKTREIGMLKALGSTSFQIMSVFLSQSLMVGVLGVASGLGMGILALHYRNGFLHLMNRLTGFELFPAKIYMFSELPALVVPGDIALICGGSLVICLLAGVLPALNAARLKPVEALRHE
jgi:lipoprotein-releasing system permease protein